MANIASLYTIVQRTSNRRVEDLQRQLSQPDIREQINSTYDGYTPLHEATMSKKPALVDCLLRHGAEVNAVYTGM